MKKLKFGLLFSALFCFGLSISSCNNAKSSEKDMTEESMDAADASATEVDMSGPEYTSAYVCPMHCKGSGSVESGECPVCGMEYVANESMKASEENEGDMDGGEMEEEGAEEGHEGHNHG